MKSIFKVPRKVKQFISTAGFTRLFYLIVFFVFFAMGYRMLSGAFLGIFIYINFNVLKKVIQDQIDKI